MPFTDSGSHRNIFYQAVEEREVWAESYRGDVKNLKYWEDKISVKDLEKEEKQFEVDVQHRGGLKEKQQARENLGRNIWIIWSGVLKYKVSP